MELTESHVEIEIHDSTSAAGVSLATLIFGILSCQVWIYFWRRSIHGRDPLWIKGIVVWIWVMQALEIAMAFRMSFLKVHRVSYPTKAEGLALISCEWATYVLTCCTTAFLVHVLFIRRVYLLDKNLTKKKFPLLISLIIALEEAFGLLSTAYVIQIKKRDPTSVHPILWTIPVWLGCSITADILIAGCLWYILNENRTGSPRTDFMIKRLMTFCVQTGLLTSIVAGMTVAIWAAAKFEVGHLLMSFPMGGIYATCLMANLVARESYFHPRRAYEDTEPECVTLGSIVFAKPDTTREKMSSGAPETMSLEQSFQGQTPAAFSASGISSRTQ